MLKRLLPLLLLPGVALGGELQTAVHTEASLLLPYVSRSKPVGDIFFNIPWDQPSFQFWRAYYRKRSNRLRLYAKVDAFKVFYPMVSKIFREEGLPPDLALLAIIESNGNPAAVSKAGAAGLWQLMPYTARRLGLRVNRFIDERFDVEKSTRAAARYLKLLHSMFGRWDLAIAAYNAGPGTIKERLRKLGADQFWDLTKLPNETLNYVPKFYALLSVVKEHRLLERPVKDRLVKVKVTTRTALYSLSRTLKVPYQLLRLYNRQYRRGIVPAGYSVYLPLSFVRSSHLVKYLKGQEVYAYTPRRPVKLSVLARRFGVSLKLLKEVNRIRGKYVYRGRTVLIVKLPSEERFNERG
ncbi:lytic transglycosylase domain-containing protein [Thermovibrio ammonificans]|uniref:Lytic transglycosylase catalytic n=1 Tax=Thermovibrio ammonificans (strain DSM 15698 / JCM 12110 / HB-1) TaxID=648996 RepID=E8T2I1_THEA1|nr:lytic transglycosylase domain-containing protein [Thermovibrio ammonificans]ADU97076.1 Lytic transglycosylase catalytic [Thermovibrio ammonificans HB-1]